MTVDHRMDLFEPGRQALSALVHPVRVIASLPADTIDRIDNQFASRRALIAENQRLRDRQQVFQARLQRLDALEVENIRLRQLLDSSYEIERPVLIAELFRIDLDPFSHLIEIDKGSLDGVYLDQPVIDANGVVGQVDQVNPFSATVRLISDPSHALAIQVNRNNLRGVAVGTGIIDKLTIHSLPSNADIEVGDLIVTSGLAGRFPVGYPVGKVRHIELEPGQPFLTVKLSPLAALDRARQVLLIGPARSATEDAQDE